MKLQTILVAAIGLAPKLAFGCVVGSATVEGLDLKICEDYAGAGRTYGRSVGIGVFKDFVAANRNNKDLAELTKKLFDFNPTQLEAYFDKELAEKRYATRMFADSDASVPDLKRLAKMFNDHYKFTALIEQLKLDKETRRSELIERSPIKSFAEVDAIAETNRREIPALTEKCKASRQANVNNVHVIEVTYSDGQIANSVPLGLIKTAGQENRGELVLIGGDQINKRTLSFRNGKFYWTGKDGKEWAVELQKASYKRVTGMRPIGFGGMSDACYLSYLYNQSQGTSGTTSNGAKTKP